MSNLPLTFERSGVHLDIQQKQLNAFMAQMVTLVNNQGEQIKEIEKSLKQKSQAEHLAQMFRAIGNAFEFNDSEVREKLHLDKPKKRKEIKGDPVQDSVEEVVERVQLMSLGWEYCLGVNREYLEQVRRVEKGLKDKVDKIYVKTKHRKAKQHSSDGLLELERKLTTRMNDLEKTHKQDNNTQRQDIRELEKKTLWKIQDCERLLKDRINGEYVEKAISKMETVLRKETQSAVKGRNQELEEKVAINSRKIKENDERTTDRMKELRRMQTDSEERLRAGYLGSEIFEQNKKATSNQLLELTRKIQEVEKRGDARDVQEKVMDYAKQLEDKQGEAQAQHIQLRMAVDEFIKQQEEKDRIRQAQSIDIHVVCGLESDMAMLKREVESMKQIQKDLDRDLEIKYQLADSSIQKEVRRLDRKDSLLIKLKDEFIQLTEKNSNKMTGEVNSLRKQVQNLEDGQRWVTLEQRLNSLEMNNDHSGLLEQLAAKITQKELNQGMQTVDKDIQTIQNILHQQQKQLTSFNEFMLSFQNHVQQLSNKEEVISVFVKNNTVTKMRCVSCGVSYPAEYKSDLLRGTDGKFYKSDQHEIGLSHGPEVTDLTLHQANKLIEAERQCSLKKSALNHQFYKQD